MSISTKKTISLSKNKTYPFIFLNSFNKNGYHTKFYSKKDNLGAPPPSKAANFCMRLSSPFTWCCRAIRATLVAYFYPSRKTVIHNTILDQISARFYTKQPNYKTEAKSAKDYTAQDKLNLFESF